MDTAGNALVLGAAGGIGSEIALTLTSNGAKAIFLADLDLEGAQKTKERCSGLKRNNLPPVNLHAARIDVTDESDVRKVVDSAFELLGRIDYFVNSAGFGNPGQVPLHDTSFNDFKAMDAVHNHGTFLTTKAVLQKMRLQEARSVVVPLHRDLSAPHPRSMSRGSIVIVASLASIGGFLGVGPYVAAKHAVIGIIQNSALENASWGIRVNAVSPSYVAGERIDSFLEQAPEVKKDILSDLPLQRLAHPTEVADAAAFLCSSSASYINGHNLILDGGASVSLAHGKF